MFRGRAVWHVNSTAKGGGVVELLQSLLAYARGAGVDARWVVIEGGADFFQITKRIHNHLHGSPGDGGGLGEHEREIYEETLRSNAAELLREVVPGDIVFLHDPQTAGLVPAMREAGVRVVWRCHVGLDLPNEMAKDAWAFLRRYVQSAEAYVFSRREFAWEGLDPERIWVVPPSIDAFSPKNQELEDGAAAAILQRAGLGDEATGMPAFLRADGTPGRVNRRATLDEGEPLTSATALISQVSRWDRLKDPGGLLRAFSEHMEDRGAHLLLAGPSVEAVADDPEAAQVLSEVREQRDALAAEVKRRVHLAQLPMEDPQENAAIVNALQRRSNIIVQKSIAEGFGLTVAEAMWKARPVVASRTGGIRDQVVNGESGVLVDDPRDLVAFATAVDGLLRDPDRAARLGEGARERVRERFLGTRHLIQYLELLDHLISSGGAGTDASGT